MFGVKIIWCMTCHIHFSGNTSNIDWKISYFIKSCTLWPKDKKKVKESLRDARGESIISLRRLFLLMHILPNDAGPPFPSPRPAGYRDYPGPVEEKERAGKTCIRLDPATTSPARFAALLFARQVAFKLSARASLTFPILNHHPERGKKRKNRWNSQLRRKRHFNNVRPARMFL